MKSELDDEASELSALSQGSSLTMCREDEVNVDEEHTIIFSSENCSDMRNNSLRHTR